jgi:hypothetical protein
MCMVALVVGCGGAGAPGEGGEGDRCAALADCGDELVCLAIGDEAPTCALTCSASADACGASAACAGVGALEIDVCQPPESVADEEGAPAEEDRPSLPCRDDTECDALYPGAVCGTWRGARECTLPCADDAVCNPPEVMGVVTTFLECGLDEGADRDICVPNEACFADPLGCISFPGAPF